MAATITVNGEVLSLEGVDPNETLLWFLRRHGLTGAKEGCAEGECGACAVALLRDLGDGARYEAINSCLVLASAMAGQELVTVEGIAAGDALHPVQSAMVEQGGSQCGYCTPGFVVSLFAEYYRPGRDGYDPEAVGGNLCRCTGYRPIRDAARSMGPVDGGDRFAARLAAGAKDLASVKSNGGTRRFYRPVTLAELYEVLGREPGAKLVNGGTDVVVEVNQRDSRFDAIVSLEAVAELSRWDETDDALIIGAGVPLSRVEERVHGKLPMLSELLPLFSSRLIRNRATFGGNLVNASPIGDGPPALLALGAELILGSAAGEREVPLDGFFTGYRQTGLKQGEVVVAIRIPKPFPQIGRFYKVSKRVLDDISTVAAAFALDLDDDQKITSARLAYGGVAATPIRAHDAEQALIGERFTPKAVQNACAILRNTVKPITDHRGSDAYRKAMVEQLLMKLHADTQMGGVLP
jgi:xanthine dehydrogenase small subunit